MAEHQTHFGSFHASRLRRNRSVDIFDLILTNLNKVFFQRWYFCVRRGLHALTQFKYATKGTCPPVSTAHRNNPKWQIRLTGLLGWILMYPLHVDAYSLTIPSYEEARNTRIINGHDAAVPLYQQILAGYPQDITAATRIAASKSTPIRQDKACPMISMECEDLKQWKHVLDACNYNNRHIQQMCGIREGGLGFDSQGPLFLRPVPAGSNLNPPTLRFDRSRDDKRVEDSSLVCLVTLFLLGFSGL